MKSPKWALKVRDLLHGAIMAAVGAAGSVFTISLSSGTFPTEGDIKKAGAIGASVGIGYLIKKFTENSNGEILKPEKI